MSMTINDADTSTTSSNDGVMLTTIDNPHSPFTDFKAWFAYDVLNGHNTCSLLARVAILPEDLTNLDDDQAIDEAIDEIIREDVLGIYKKVYRPI